MKRRPSSCRHDLLVGGQAANASLSTLDQLGSGQQRPLGQGQDLRLPLIGAIPPEQLGVGVLTAVQQVDRC